MIYNIIIYHLYPIEIPLDISIFVGADLPSMLTTLGVPGLGVSFQCGMVKLETVQPGGASDTDRWTETVHGG